ncbi:hypothetical protein V6N11_009452 [Hibiscus sabdariffa]|uniref:Uncharacterized protein n=1 Tax=Hibiscus sabdariffa TaxID=183260 RepID=A0ABR2P5C8_9ROSI
MVMKESFRPSSSKSAKEKMYVRTSSSAHGRDDEMEDIVWAFGGRPEKPLLFPPQLAIFFSFQAYADRMG